MTNSDGCTIVCFLLQNLKFAIFFVFGLRTKINIPGYPELSVVYTNYFADVLSPIYFLQKIGFDRPILVFL